MASTLSPHSTTQEEKFGYVALLCNLIWAGCMPLYYRLFQAINPIEVLVHKTVGVFVCLSVALLVLRPQAMRLHVAELRLSGIPAALLALDWIAYVYAVLTGHALQASLGYFLSPVLSAGLGVLVLKERLHGLQRIALGLGMLGTFFYSVLEGLIPVYALVMALTFSLLSLVRRRWPTGDALASTWRETLWMLPLAALAEVFLWCTAQTAAKGTSIRELLLLAGPLSAVPICLYAFALARVRLTEVAMLQYITPTLIFCLSIGVLHEAMSLPKLCAFLLIWTGLALHAYTLLKTRF